MRERSANHPQRKRVSQWGIKCGEKVKSEMQTSESERECVLQLSGVVVLMIVPFGVVGEPVVLILLEMMMMMLIV